MASVVPRTHLSTPQHPDATCDHSYGSTGRGAAVPGYESGYLLYHWHGGVFLGVQ